MQELSGELFAEAARQVDGPDASGSILDLLGWRNAAPRPVNARALLEFAGHHERFLFGTLPGASGVFLFGTPPIPRAGLIGASGCGISPGAAFAACLGELAELIAYRADRTSQLVQIAPAASGLTTDERDWCGRMLGIPVDGLDGLDWIGGARMDDGTAVHIPADLVIRREPHQNRSGCPITNSGMGAGPNRETAMASALHELIERDAVAMWWYGGARGRLIDPGTGGPDPSAMLASMGRRTDRQVWLLDISSDLGCATVAALSSDKAGGGVVMGFKTAADIATAAHGALIELCQMEFAQWISVRKAEQLAPADLGSQDRSWLRKHRELSVATYPRLRPEIAALEIARGAEGLAGTGIRPIVVDLCVPDIGFPVVRVVAPGLQPAKGPFTSRRLHAVLTQNAVELDLQQISPI